MDPTELMGFAARGLFMNRRSNENTANFAGVGPLKAWNNFWKQVAQDRGIGAVSITAEAM